MFGTMIYDDDDHEIDDDDDYYYYYYYGDYEYGAEYDDISNTGISGLTALHIAVMEHSAMFVAKLLKVSNIIVDHKNEYGGTPLFDAAHMGSIKIMTMLHVAGADIHAKDEYGSMPIHAAAESGKLKAVKTLIQLGEDLNVRGYADGTPLILAVEYHNYDVAQYLVHMGADVQIQDNNNMSAMDYAIKYEDKEMEQILKGCLIHDKTYSKNHDNNMYYKISDLGLAARDNDVDAVDDLIKKVRLLISI